MKRFLKILLVFILVLGFSACGKSNTKKAEKVKVYVFEAGGCPYCEQEIEYLKSLDGLDTKFEIVQKELYVDHINWEAGKDFDLGVKVSNAFNEKGYNDATYQATPFVVISDIYASSGLNTDLAGVINTAYEEGDNDVVGSISNGKSYDIRKNETEIDKTFNAINKTYTINFIIVYVLLGLIFIYLFITRNKKNKIVKTNTNSNEEKIKKSTKQTKKKK